MLKRIPIAVAAQEKQVKEYDAECKSKN